MFWTVDRSTSERGITGLETAIILIAFCGRRFGVRVHRAVDGYFRVREIKRNRACGSSRGEKYPRTSWCYRGILGRPRRNRHYLQGFINSHERG